MADLSHKMADLLRFVNIAFYVVNFNNGGGLLSSVQLFCFVLILKHS